MVLERIAASGETSPAYSTTAALRLPGLGDALLGHVALRLFSNCRLNSNSCRGLAACHFLGGSFRKCDKRPLGRSAQ
jgi:hypothetical protein